MNMVGGWWLSFNPSEKYEFVNWDDDLSNISGKINHVPNHHPVILSLQMFLGIYILMVAKSCTAKKDG